MYVFTMYAFHMYARFHVLLSFICTSSVQPPFMFNLYLRFFHFMPPMSIPTTKPSKPARPPHPPKMKGADSDRRPTISTYWRRRAFRLASDGRGLPPSGLKHISPAMSSRVLAYRVLLNWACRKTVVSRLNSAPTRPTTPRFHALMDEDDRRATAFKET